VPVWPTASAASLPSGLPERQAGDAQLVRIDGEQPETKTVEARGDGVGHAAAEPHPDPAAGPGLAHLGHGF
jgi:hypothetical protein